MSASKNGGEFQLNTVFFRLAQSFSGNTLQFFVDVNIGFAAFDALRRNIYAIPGQAEQFTQSQGTGKGKMDCQFEKIIVAEVNRPEQRFGIPYLPFVFFAFWERGVLNRVTGHQLPLDRLIKGVAEQLVNLPYRPGPDKAIFGYTVGAGFGLDRFELLVEVIHHPRIDVVQSPIPDKGPDVVVDQRLVALISRGCPGVDAIDGDVLI